MSVIQQEQQDFTSPEEEIEFLRNHIDKLEANRKKLISQFNTKKAKDEIFNVNLPESELNNFNQHDKCDQKLLAVLYWEKLSDQQKSVFTDREEMELAKNFERKMQEIMIDPSKMRRHFLLGSAPILDNMIDMATGGTKLGSSDTYAFTQVWEILRGIISTANNPTPMIDLKGKDVSEQIDEILTQVTEGKLSFDEAKEFMSLVSSGFNLQELPKLMAKLEALESHT